MKNLLIITQKVDENDDLLGFFVDWIKEFSKHFNKVNVITLGKGSYNLPDNVSIYSLGKENSSSRLWRVFKFYYYLSKLTSESTSVFCHMSPIFAIAAWPFSFVHRNKLILWYLHRSVTLRLKIALLLCHNIVTASKESLNIKSSKIIELGHGINISKFANSEPKDFSQLKILSVGRISKIKNFETLIDAVRLLKEKGVDFKVSIIGRPVMFGDEEYFNDLKNRVISNELSGFIDFVGFVPYSEIRKYYLENNILINLAPIGGIDKVVLEGMASGMVTLTSNRNFSRYFNGYSENLIFDFNDPEDLSLKLVNIKNMKNEELLKIQDSLKMSVIKDHDLRNLIEKLSVILS